MQNITSLGRLQFPQLSQHAFDQVFYLEKISDLVAVQCREVAPLHLSAHCWIKAEYLLDPLREQSALPERFAFKLPFILIALARLCDGGSSIVNFCLNLIMEASRTSRVIMRSP